MEENIIYTLLLGSNLGEREKYLKGARDLLEKSGRIIGASSIMETEAWGKTDQNDFLNQVILLESMLTPQDLLNRIHEIEESLGRIRIEKWGPRTVDIDILYAQNLIIQEENLTIPHPAIADRHFTLVLLQELIPEFIDPISHKTAGEMMQELALTN